MYGYILVAIGLYLIGEDIVKARRAKNAKLLENGNGGSGSDINRKPRTNGKEPDRDGRIKPFPVKNKGGKHELHKKPVSPDKLDPPGGGAGDNSSGQPDATSIGDKAKGVNGKEKGEVDEINSENGAGNDGDNVDVKLSGINEPDGTKTD